jgi:nicotinamidase-related amidase
MQNTYLIIIDPQKDFIHPQGNYGRRHPIDVYIPKARQSIVELLQLVPVSRVLIILSDYTEFQFHPAESFCVPGTKGHEIDLHVRPEHRQFRKQTHSAFSSETFSAFLKEQRVTRILVAGFLTEYCVKATALDAIMAKLQVSVIADAVATGDDVQNRQIETINLLESHGVHTITKEDAVALFRSVTQ